MHTTTVGQRGILVPVNQSDNPVDPFRSYIGKRARIRDRQYVIESYQVIGRDLQFVAVCRDDGSRVRLSVLEMLESVEAVEAA